jgi:hypothetical protein
MHSIMKRVFFILPVAVLAVRVRKAGSASDSDSASDSNDRWEESQADALHDEEEWDAGILTYRNNYGGYHLEDMNDKVELNIEEMNADEEYDVRDLLYESNDKLAAGLYGMFNGHVAGMNLNFDKVHETNSGEVASGLRHLVTGYGDRTHKKEVDTTGELNPLEHPLVDAHYAELERRGEEIANPELDEYVELIGEEIFEKMVNQEDDHEVADIIKEFAIAVEEDSLD